jgi:hypothetical protein
MKVRDHGQAGTGALLLLTAMSALALWSCTTAASGAVGSPSSAVVQSNVSHGDRNFMLSDLSCSSMHDCWAIGVDTVPEGQVEPSNGTLLMHFDGSAWHQVLHTGNASSINAPLLGNLSCPARGWCMATVEYSGQTAGTHHPSFAIISNGQLRLRSTTAIGELPEKGNATGASTPRQVLPSQARLLEVPPGLLLAALLRRPRRRGWTCRARRR